MTTFMTVGIILLIALGLLILGTAIYVRVEYPPRYSGHDDKEGGEK